MQNASIFDTYRKFDSIFALVVCYHKVTHQCQSKTLSPPDFESTYTNKVCLRLWRCANFDRSETKDYGTLLRHCSGSRL